MTTQTTVIGDVFDALQEQLSELDGLAGVTVVSGDLFEDTPREAVTLYGSDDWSQTWSTTGNLRRAESFTIDYSIWIVKPGGGEATIREARNRALAIQAAIEGYLRTSAIHGDAVDGITLQGLVKEAEAKPRRIFNGVHPQGRVCQIDGGIAINASLRRS